MTGTEFADAALDLVGTPYRECDCIGVVRKPLRLKIQGTNWLWRSIYNSPKYQYATMRSSKPPEGDELQDGLVVFRIKWDVVPEGYTDKPDAHHVGVIIYTNRWNVIQSNPKTGVVINDYNPGNWDGYIRMKQVDYKPAASPEDPHELTDHEMIVAIYNKIMGRD